MNLLKAKVAAEPKVFRKAATSKIGQPYAQQQLYKKVSLNRPVYSPRKESFKAKVTLGAWSGKKRLSVVRDDQAGTELRGEESDLKKPSQSTDSVEAERPDADNFRYYGFADLLVRHKSAHGDISYRTNSYYFYKKPDRYQNIQRVASPETQSTGRRRVNGDVNDQQMRRGIPEEAAKENSVNKNNLEGRHQLYYPGGNRSMSSNGKRTELASTAPQLYEQTDQRLGTVSVLGTPTGGSTNSLQPHNRPIVFDIRSSTTLSRYLAPVELHERERPVQPPRYMKKQQTVQHAHPQQRPACHDEPDYHILGKPSLNGTHSQLYSYYSYLKAKYLKYERILGYKQKEINKLELYNHNLKVDIKNNQIKVCSVEEYKQKLLHVQSTNEGSLQELRMEIASLRKEAALTKTKHQQDLQKSEKEVKEQYGQLIHEKNNQIAKLNLAIRERQTEIEGMRQELQRQTNDLQKAGTKESELEKLVEYYRKETKMIGVEMFNLKKKLDLEIKGRADSESHSSMLDTRLQYQVKLLSEAHQQLKEKDKYTAYKLKQSQHEKNLLYDSMTTALRTKDIYINNLRKDLYNGTNNSSTNLSTSATFKPGALSADSKHELEALKKQVDQLTSDINLARKYLARETDEKQKLLAYKKQLTGMLLERQKKYDEDKIKLYQSQSLKSLDVSRVVPPPKPSYLDRLNLYLNAKNNELQVVAKSLKTCQQRCSSLYSLLESTNYELFVLRLQGLCRKIQPY